MQLTPQEELVLEYYKKRPNVVVKSSDAEDWARSEAKELGMSLRNPGRVIRRLSEKGVLKSVGRGEYMYEPQ